MVIFIKNVQLKKVNYIYFVNIVNFTVLNVLLTVLNNFYFVLACQKTQQILNGQFNRQSIQLFFFLTKENKILKFQM